jgi:hypothetical protein
VSLTFPVSNAPRLIPELSARIANASKRLLADCDEKLLTVGGRSFAESTTVGWGDGVGESIAVATMGLATGSKN